MLEQYLLPEELTTERLKTKTPEADRSQGVGVDSGRSLDDFRK